MKVIIIDDDRTMTDLVGIMLTTSGLEVLTTNSGEYGIQLVKEENPDIIILDLMMPDKDGWEVCKNLRTFTTTPVLIISALDDPAIISSALDAGADDYIVKPISSNVLIARIKTLTRRHSAQQNGSKIVACAVGSQITNQFATIQKPLQA